jgi:hypothetical protein
MTYVPSVRPVTPKPDGFRELYVKHPQEHNNSSQEKLRSQANHFFYYLHLLTRTLTT